MVACHVPNVKAWARFPLLALESKTNEKIYIPTDRRVTTP